MKNKPMQTVLWGFLAVLVACATACSSTEEAAKQKDEARVRQEMAMRMWKNRCETKAGIKMPADHRKRGWNFPDKTPPR